MEISRDPPGTGTEQGPEVSLTGTENTTITAKPQTRVPQMKNLRKKTCQVAQGQAYWPKVHVIEENNNYEKSEQKAVLQLVFH